MNRRKFFGALAVAPVAVPAIIAAAEATPVRYVLRTHIPAPAWRMYNQGAPYGRSPAMDALPSLRELRDKMPAYEDLRELMREIDDEDSE